MDPIGRMPNVAWTKLACLWPGLPQLWARGAWSGLALAVGFTVLVNLLLVAGLVWTEWLSPRLVTSVWFVVLVLWIGSAWVSLRGTSQQVPAQARAADEDFREAMGHYLAGNWFETEKLLGQVIRRNVADCDARLMRATLWRHTGRLDEAADELTRIGLSDGAAKWQQEIESERLLLTRARAEQTASPESRTESSDVRTIY